MATEWKEVCIADLGEVVGGATPSTKNASFYGGDIAWITPKDLSNFNERYISRGERNITELGKQSCSTKLLPKNSVLFTSRAPIGYVAIAENELCTNQGFKSIIPNENTDYLFLFYLLKYNKNKIEAMGSGTTFKEVSARVMQSIKLRVPDKETQQMDNFIAIANDKATTMGHIKREHLEKAKVFVPAQKAYQQLDNLLNPILEYSLNLRIENKKLVQIRDTLLPKFMSGELEV